MANIGNSFENSCVLTAVGVFAIVLNSAVVTHIGRRRVFLTVGLFICGLSQLLTAIIYTISPGTQSTGKGIVALAIIYIFGYNVSTVALLTSALLTNHREWWPHTRGFQVESCPHSGFGLTLLASRQPSVSLPPGWRHSLRHTSSTRSL